MATPGDILVVVHEFQARSPDELTLARGERIELIESDQEFGDGWYLGRNIETNDSGLFPEVYTRPAPKSSQQAVHQRSSSQATLQPAQHGTPPVDVSPPSPTAPLPLATAASPAPPEGAPGTEPLQVPSPAAAATQAGAANRSPLLQTRSISQTLGGDPAHEEDSMNSPVMHETLSVIDEHITDMSTPRHSAAAKDMRGNDSSSEYSSQHRLSYINGQETEEEEQDLHTEQEVSTWSPARVAEYLEDVGVERKHCDIFQDQEINGEVLLGMDQATIFLKEFELGPVGPRLRTWLKIKALQEEVKNMKEAQMNMAMLDGQEEDSLDTARNRSTSLGSMGAVLPRIPSLGQGQQPPRSAHGRQPLPRANSSAGQSPVPVMEATSPLAQYAPVSSTRPSAASIRNLNHNRRHSSIDSAMNMPPPTSAGAMKSTRVAPSVPSHRKSPSFDRGWTMNLPQDSPQALMRPSSSQHAHSTSTEVNTYTTRNGDLSVITPDLDRGYFSGPEIDNRKGRNVLRKKDSPAHSRNPSFGSDGGHRGGFSRRHSRIGSSGSATGATGGGSPVSPAAKAYYGSSIKSGRSSNFEYGRPLKSTNDVSPTVTKLEYTDSPTIAIAHSPQLPPSEASSTDRAPPSPTTQSHSLSFFGKKSRSTGLRAISDAITGNERAQANSADAPVRESPLQSPARTGSSTPSGTSATKSFESEALELSKRNTSGSTSTKDTGGKKKSKKHGTSAYTRGRQPITPQEAMKQCDYSGWMKKKSSSLMTTWKTRLFVLRGRRLSYYYTESDTEEKGLIDISSHRVLPANNEKITGLHAALTRATSSPTSPQGATIPTNASTDNVNALGEDMSGMFIFKLVPPRAGLQRGVQFTKPIVHYFAVDSIQVGRLWMAALMKATIDRDDALAITTTYQQKTITLDKARQMRQRPPALMDEDAENASVQTESKKSVHSKESIQESVIHEEDERQGLAISGLDDAKALLDYAESGESPQEIPTTEPPLSPSPGSPRSKHKRKESFTPGLMTFG